MAYRTKSPARVLEELRVLARRTGALRSPPRITSLARTSCSRYLPRSPAPDSDYRLFNEIKASVGREELRLMHSAGVRALQPGIESLSTRLLQLMRKGTRASQNVNFLRWARYYGSELYWNVLLGFPGQTQEDYAVRGRLARTLVPLEPPVGSVRIGLESFSLTSKTRSGFRCAVGLRAPNRATRTPIRLPWIWIGPLTTSPGA
jgi:radical SAM superfamily enzyme YgiQ (UPF0313 family)